MHISSIDGGAAAAGDSTPPAAARSPHLHQVSAGDARKRPVGRPRALDAEKVALVNRLHALGVSKSAIARTLGVSRPTVYRALADVEAAHPA
ncbi:helix-turn-helix domain-containing protein [Mycobacterium sp. B14F4]|uniref:helix-turn-helix domain-containing protein n=1 Tax=Mycobacterium sp. B14F4 TaxID=3153565 RepID=UPI00325F5F9B